MFAKLKQVFGFATKQPEPEAKKASKYSLNFPSEIFDGGYSKEWPRKKLTKVFPFTSLLGSVVREKFPDLYAANQSRKPVEAYQAIAAAAGVAYPGGKGIGIETLSLHLLIHLEQRDLLNIIAEKFPVQYQRAADDQAGEIDPLKFTVRLLEEFGVQDRNFPACFDALKAKVLIGPKPDTTPNMAPA